MDMESPEPQTVRYGRIFLSCYGAGLVVFLLTAGVAAAVAHQPEEPVLVATDIHYNSAMVQQIQPYFPKAFHTQ